MNELDKLKAWMATNNLTTSQLATEMGIPYITAYMCIENRKLLSANFERHFRKRFGSEITDHIFGVPVATPSLIP